MCTTTKHSRPPHPNPPILRKGKKVMNALHPQGMEYYHYWHILSPSSLPCPNCHPSLYTTPGNICNIVHILLVHRYFNRYLIIGNDNKYCQKCIGRLNSPCCQKSCSVAASLLCNIFLHHLASVVAKKSPWPG